MKRLEAIRVRLEAVEKNMSLLGRYTRLRRSRYLGGAYALDVVNGCGDRLLHVGDIFGGQCFMNLIESSVDDIRDLLAVAEMATHYPVCIDCAASRDQDGQLVHEPGCSMGALLMEVEG